MGVNTSNRFHTGRSKTSGERKKCGIVHDSNSSFKAFPLTYFTKVPRIVASIDHSCLGSVRRSHERVTCLKFAPQNACFLLTGTRSSLNHPEEFGIPGALRSWNFSNKQHLLSGQTLHLDLGNKKEEIYAEHTITCDISPDMRTVAYLISTGEGSICLWKKPREWEIRSRNRGMDISYQHLCGMTGLPVSCSFSPDSKKIISVICTDYFTVMERNAVFLWDVKSFKLESKVWLQGNVFGGCVTSSCFSPDGKLISVVSNGGSLCLLGGQNLHLRAVSKVGQENKSLWCFFDPLFKHERLVLGHQNGCITTWGIKCYDTSIELCFLSKTDVVSSSNEMTCMAWSPDTSWLAVGTSDAKIRVLNSKNFSCVTELNPFAHGESYYLSLEVSCLDFTNTSDCLAAGYTNSKVLVWQLPLIFSLQYLCRSAIIKVVKLSDIEFLPVSHRIKKYLQNLHNLGQESST